MPATASTRWRSRSSPHPATHEDPWVRSDLVLELARAAGPAGMAGGQMMDLAAEGQQLDLPPITRLQQLKTGALIEYAVEAACIMAKLPAEARTPYRGYARNIGLAFQIADDLIDHSGDEARGGQADRQGRAMPARRRSSRCSARSGRGSRRASSSTRRSSISPSHGEEADLLRAIARFAIERDH